MKTKEELTKIYHSLNDNEKYGIQFGLFPILLKGLEHEEIVELMQIRKELEKQDINKDILRELSENRSRGRS